MTEKGLQRIIRATRSIDRERSRIELDRLRGAELKGMRAKTRGGRGHGGNPHKMLIPTS